jgi:antitoxin FitA
MSINLSIKGVPERVADQLRARAERNHRSLQGELMAIIESAATEMAPPAAVQPRGTEPLLRRGWKSIDDLVADRRERGTLPSQGLPLAVDIVRADRDSR